MLLFKFLGIFLIVCSCATVGFLKSFSVKARYKKLSCFYERLNTLYEHVESGGCELEKALKNSFLTCDFLTFQNNRIYCRDNDLTKDDKSLIDEFFLSLGYSVKKIECDRIKAFAITLKTRLKQVENEATQKSKIYQTLGICTGLALGVFFI
ncbi:MAG: stage III sporulation protein AB [Clostridia bacterium]|nr:stage III sporulation protein AB [Clostridia bacterium]